MIIFKAETHGCLSVCLSLYVCIPYLEGLYCISANICDELVFIDDSTCCFLLYKRLK